MVLKDWLKLKNKMHNMQQKQLKPIQLAMKLTQFFNEYWPKPAMG